MSDQIPPEDLVQAVGGNLASFQRLLAAGWARMQERADQIPAMYLTRDGVLSVLVAFRDGTASPELVQEWASFLRWGYFGSYDGPVQPLDIFYDPNFEEDIVEVIGRLDELGDLIDGTIDPEELSEMIKRMTK